MEICAIILNYRKAEETAACIRSLIAQHIDTVLVVDNSEDKQAAEELANALASLKEEADFCLHTIRPPRNLGFAGGVNFACNSQFARSTDAFLLINNDAQAASGMVCGLAASLTSGAIVAAPVVFDAHGIMQPALWYQRHLGLISRKRLPGAFAFPSGCCLLLKKDLLANGRLLDEDFFMYGEDVFLGWQLFQRNHLNSHFLVDDTITYHKRKESSNAADFFYEYHTAKAHILLSFKTCHSRLEIPLLLVGKAIGMSLRAAYRSIRYRSFTPLFAFFLAWLPLTIRPDGKRQN